MVGRSLENRGFFAWLWVLPQWKKCIQEATILVCLTINRRDNRHIRLLDGWISIFLSKKKSFFSIHWVVLTPFLCSLRPFFHRVPQRTSILSPILGFHHQRTPRLPTHHNEIPSTGAEFPKYWMALNNNQEGKYQTVDTAEIPIPPTTTSESGEPELVHEGCRRWLAVETKTDRRLSRRTEK